MELLEETIEKLHQKNGNTNIYNLFIGGQHVNDQSRNFTNSGNAANVNLGNDFDVKSESIDQNTGYIDGISDNTLGELKNEIIDVLKNEERKQEEVLGHYDKLKQSLEKHDKEGAKKYLTWIKESIGTVSSVVTIGTSLGIL